MISVRLDDTVISFDTWKHYIRACFEAYLTLCVLYLRGLAHASSQEFHEL